MPFKIVNTIEKGKSVLTTVPNEWEKDGHLYWPRINSMKADKLRRSEYSKPEEDWKITNCILKRQNLKSFDVAEFEVEKMCPNSDTETDSEREKKTVKNKELPLAFDKIVNECLGVSSSYLLGLTKETTKTLGLNAASHTRQISPKNSKSRKKITFLTTYLPNS